MTKSFIYRIALPRGLQKKLIIESKKNTATTYVSLSLKLGVHPRTLADWKREKFLIPLDVAITLLKLSKIKLPKNFEIRDQYWYTRKGAYLGGVNSYKKQGVIGGDPNRRKARWKEWWETIGKFQKLEILQRKKMIMPRKSVELAEFTGIMMGDGGISPRQITITLHHIDDKDYLVYVISLIRKLFGVEPSIYHRERDSTNTITVSRTSLVDFCIDKLGLPLGNKIRQNIDIPKWILKNQEYKKACVRGLIDTDGSIFTHIYSVKGKQYSYKKLHFTSLSPALAQSVYKILKEFNFNSRIYRNKDVCLDSIGDVKRYFEFIQTHNPKHLRRYRN